MENFAKRRKPKIKNRLRYCRTALNIGQEKMALLMDVSQSQISRWENGEREPRVNNAIGLAAITHRMVEDVFFDYRQEWQEKLRKKEKLFNSEEKVEKTFTETKI